MRILHLSSAFCLVLAVLSASTNSASATSCADKVSSGDRSIGITAVEDAACATGGLGCFSNGEQCRFCSESGSSESKHLKLCSDIPVSMVSTGSPHESTKSGMKAADTSSPESVEAAIDCVSRVSVGDQGVGISAVAATTASCGANGLGCFESSRCRFCQSRSTVQSSPYLKCSSFGGSSAPTGTTSTSAPAISTPSPTAASTSTSCSSVVSRSGLDGISYVSEIRCNVASPILLGCSARTSCRLCRNYKNEANQYLMSCQVLKDLGATESATATSTSTDKGATESVAIDSSAADTLVQSSGKGKTSVSTESAAVAAGAVSGTGSAIGATAAVVAILVVVMMSVMYVKGRRDPLDECMTPDDGPGSDLMTPHGGRGYTPREGSLVMVVSQSSIATL